MPTAPVDIASRIMPPASILAAVKQELPLFAPAQGMHEWAMSVFVEPDGILHNPEHEHWASMVKTVAWLWTSVLYAKGGRTVAGTCEEVMFRASKWQSGRQEQQMLEWFGEVPDYLITLSAPVWLECDSATRCGIVEHEMCHVGQMRDEFGAPAYTKDGFPKIYLRPHDAEAFVTITERYGAGNAEGGVARLVHAGSRAPSIAAADIAIACGNG